MRNRTLLRLFVAGLATFIAVGVALYLWLPDSIPAPDSSAFPAPDSSSLMNTIEKDAQDTGKTIPPDRALEPLSSFIQAVEAVEKAAQDTGKTIEKATQDAGKTIEKATQDAGKTIEKATQDPGKNIEKAAQDTGKTIEKGAQDTGKTIELVLGASDKPLSPLDAELKKLIGGNIAFNTPERMSIGKSQVIEAKLSVKLPVTELMDQLTEAGKKESSAIKVADRMSASLSGGGAFDVSPSGPQEQLISQNEVTTWTWDVTPKQAGTQRLLLSFDAVFLIDGKAGNRNINTFKRKIEVQVAWPETASEWLDYFKKLFEEASWLWASILVPLGVWIWARFRKKPPPGGTTGATTEPETPPQAKSA